MVQTPERLSIRECLRKYGPLMGGLTAALGVNFPGGTVQHNTGIYASGPGGTMLWGQHSNQRVMMARIGVTSAAGGETASFWVPNVDDNFGLYVEDPSSGPGTITTSGANVTGVGTSFQNTDIGKLLLVQGTLNPVGQANLITARGSTTACTLQEAYSTDVAGATAYKLLSKVIQRSNGVAQTTVNDVATYAFTVGNSVLWLFFNQDGATQAALNLYTNMYEVAGLSFYDVGVENWG